MSCRSADVTVLEHSETTQVRINSPVQHSLASESATDLHLAQYQTKLKHQSQVIWSSMDSTSMIQ